MLARPGLADGLDEPLLLQRVEDPNRLQRLLNDSFSLHIQFQRKQAAPSIGLDASEKAAGVDSHLLEFSHQR